MAKKKVLIVCGSGIATSTVVREKLLELADEHGLDLELSQCMTSAVSVEASGFDLVVSTTGLPDNLGVPSFSALPFLTGVGEQELAERIVNYLKSS